jgi:uncharacterized protein YqjF (DUF2071 family)
MHQRWADLLFAHWELPVAALRPLVPAGLEVDTFEGRAYVGLVPFTMSGVRPWWSPPVPGLSAFPEVNVRTYVHCDGRDPGVWFLSLDAANPVAVLAARTFWRLPYHWARMRVRRDGKWILYSSARRHRPAPATCSFRYAPMGSPRSASPGTLEHFLVERYLLYAETRRGLQIGQVHHSPYPLQAALLDGLQETLLGAAGLDRPEAPPLLHFASEVTVQVFSLRPAGFDSPRGGA